MRPEQTTRLGEYREILPSLFANHMMGVLDTVTMSVLYPHIPSL